MKNEAFKEWFMLLFLAGLGIAFLLLPLNSLFHRLLSSGLAVFFLFPLVNKLYAILSKEIASFEFKN